jgi:SAM-dependent methyltransferase
VAELYDQARPSYPRALVDAAVAFAGAGPGEWAVEVGAGTGKGTLQFAAHGLRIVALEPSREMARVLRANTADCENVAVEEAEFEHWRPERKFRLLYSAQAWHWIDPGVRYARAAAVLVEGGALAVFWNRPRWESCPFRDELAEAYRRAAPDLGSEVGPGPMHPAAEVSQRWWGDWTSELEDAPGFGEAEIRTYVWNRPYRADEYVRLLRTHSDHVVLEPGARSALLDAVARVIDTHGGTLDLEYAATLIMARRISSPATGLG